MTSWLRVLLVASLSLLSARAAADEPADRDLVGILQVSTQGVSETAGEMLEQSIEEGLAGTGFRMVRSQALAESLLAGNYVDGCTFGPCLRSVHETTGIRLVLVARIHGEGSSYGFVISLLDTRSGTLTSQVAETCSVCTVEEAIFTATETVVELVTGTGDAEVTDPSAGPTGARSPLGPLPMQRLTRADDRRRSWRRGALVALGAGVAAGALGAYLWQDEREAPGAAALGAGGAMLLGGGAMLLLSRPF